MFVDLDKCNASISGIVSLAAPSAPQWSFDVKNTTSGVLALEAIVVSPSLVVIFDREYTVDNLILD